MLKGLDLQADRILFICGADSTGLDEIISHRGRHLEQPILDNDLIEWGMLPDFVRRAYLSVWWNPLEEASLARIVSTIDVKLSIRRLVPVGA